MPRYGKIRSQIWTSSKKFKSLKPHGDAALLYFYLHTCQHCNNTGCFVLPPAYIVDDMGWKEGQVVEARKALLFAKLIDYDEDEEIIRIIGFMVQDPPANKNHATSMYRTIRDLPSCQCQMEAFKELFSTKHGMELSTSVDDLSTDGNRFDTVSETVSETVSKPLGEGDGIGKGKVGVEGLGEGEDDDYDDVARHWHALEMSHPDKEWVQSWIDRGRKKDLIDALRKIRGLPKRPRALRPYVEKMLDAD